MRAFRTPRWLGRHALLLVCLVVLGRIGWWQFETAQREGDWQNYGYALQWWLFGGFAVFLWVKLVLDELDPERRDQSSASTAQELPRVVRERAAAQAPAAAEDEDPELAAYNRHLARLAENGRG